RKTTSDLFLLPDVATALGRQRATLERKRPATEIRTKHGQSHLTDWIFIPHWLVFLRKLAPQAGFGTASSERREELRFPRKQPGAIFAERESGSSGWIRTSNPPVNSGPNGPRPHAAVLLEKPTSPDPTGARYRGWLDDSTSAAFRSTGLR